MTRREYFYTIDLRGNLILDGAILDDPAFLDFFFKRVRRNDSGVHVDYPFYSPCGPEWNFIAAMDTPLVFQKLVDNKLYYSPSLYVEFDARQLRFGDNGVLYHAAPSGDYARLLPHLAVEISKCVRPWGPWFAYRAEHSGIDEIIAPLVTHDELQLIRPRDGNMCVGCGRDAVNGLHLSFLYKPSERRVESWFTADNRLMGSLNIMHGGFVSLLLDETMGKILGAMHIKAPTAQLNVRFRQPVPIHEELLLRATLQRQEGRKNFVHGEILSTRPSQKVLAEADALFITMRSTME